MYLLHIIMSITWLYRSGDGQLEKKLEWGTSAFLLQTTMPLSWRCVLRTDFETMERRGSIVNVDVLTTNQCSAPSAIAMIGRRRAPLDDVLSRGSGPCRPRTRRNAMVREEAQIKDPRRALDSSERIRIYFLHLLPGQRAPD